MNTASIAPKPHSHVKRIAIVAGEASGDYLGAQLIKQLKVQWPNARFEGIAGPLMQAQGCESLFMLDRLAVTGISEVLSRLFELLAMRRRLIQRWRNHPPDVFIGVDAPDFNIGLEAALKQHGIKTVHYVSPTVWAWRPERIHHIGQAVSLVLALFPFETGIYREHGIPIEFVGHPMADEIPMISDKAQARAQLQLDPAAKILALLPGSRGNEIRKLAKDFLKAAALLRRRVEDLHIVIPLVSESHKNIVRQIMQENAMDFPVHMFLGKAREAITAADSVLTASGTATLESLLIKRPMVVAYRVAGITYWLAKRRVKIPFIALPNILAGRLLVPEFVQYAITPEKLAEALAQLLTHPEQSAELQLAFSRIHEALRRNASVTAAAAVAALIEQAA